jgi:hypothetical protein
MPLTAAIKSALDWAADIVADTIFVRGKMMEDETGASYATHGALRNYAAMPEDAPISTHMAGIETLRTHSKTQIPRKAWQAAYDAISAENTKQRNPELPEGVAVRIYHPTKSVKSGLADGTHYNLDEAKKKVNLRLPLRRTGPRASELLTAAGVPRTAYTWFAAPGEAYKSWIAVDPAWTLPIADALAEHYPELARALRQNAPMWVKLIGVTPVEVKATEGMSPEAKALSGATRDGVRWEWAGGSDVSFNIPRDAKGILTTAGVRFSWDVRGEGTTKEYWVRIPVGGLENAIAAIGRRYGQSTDILTSMIPIWTGGAAKSVEERASKAAAVDIGTAQPESGTSPENVAWRWEKEAFRVRFLFPKPAKALLTSGNVDFAWDVKSKGTDTPCPKGSSTACDYWMAVPVTGLGPLPAAIKADYPVTARIVEALSPTWASTRAAMKQDATSGATEEGSWVTLPSGTVQLRTMYKADARGWEKKIKAVVTLSKDEKGWYHSFQAKRVMLVTDALRAYYPKLAEALNRAFGGIARIHAAEEPDLAAKCDPLTDMSTAKDPASVKSEVGRAVIEDVLSALRQRIPYGLAIKPFQVVGIAFAKLTGYRALIGDAMGLGKTVSALGAIAVDPEMLLPTVVVCPSSVLYNWVAESNKWLPRVPIHMLSDGKTPLPPKGWNGIIVTTWSLLPKHVDRLVDFGIKLFVGDESHYVKEITAQRSKAAAKLAEHVPHVLLLTGTPIKNRAIELWHLLHILDADTWGTRAVFGQQYTHVEHIRAQGKDVVKYEGGRNLDELHQRLLCVMVRRLKDDVLSELPPKTRSYLPIPLDPPARKEYDRAFGEFAGWLDTELTRRMRAAFEAEGTTERGADAELRQAVSMRVAKALQAEALVKLGYLRRLVGASKVGPAVERISEFADAGEPVIVFAEHKAVVAGIQDGLEKLGIKYVTIDGSTPAEGRKSIVDAFQRGDVGVFIGTQAAKEGITLTRASNTIFVERWWTPGDEEQAEDRNHRIGQRGAVTIWFLHAMNTIDDHLKALIEAKRVVVNAAVGGKDVETVDAPDVDIISLIRGKGRVALSTSISGTVPKTNPTAPGIPKGTAVQTLLFAASEWSPKTAGYWATMHRFQGDGCEKSGAWLKYVQTPTGSFRKGSFRTVQLTPTIHAVVGIPRH